MCNMILASDYEYRKEPEEGIGWKIFEVHSDGLYPMMGKAYSWPKTPYIQNEWIKFKSRHSNTGFCFFLDFEIASKVLEAWKKLGESHGFSYQIYQINYKECLGSKVMSIVHIENYGGLQRGAIARQILI